MPKSIRIFFYSFLFAPFYAYLLLQHIVIIPYSFLGSIAMILLLLHTANKQRHIPTYIYPLILFAIYYSVWDFFNGRYEEFGIVKLLFKNYPLHILAVLLIIENVVFDELFIKKLVMGFKILLIASVIFTLIQLFINPMFFATEESSASDLATFSFEVRNTSIWGYLHPMDVGLSFLPVLAILGGYLFYNRKFKQVFFFYIIGGLVSVFTNSRWTLLNYLIITLPILFSIKRKGLKTGITIILSVFIFGFTINNMFNSLGFDFATYLEGRILSKSSESRFMAIELFEEFFPLNPLFGSGVRVDPELKSALAGKSSQIHIGYLSSLYEFGLIGSVFLFSFWLMLFIKLHKNSKLHNQRFLKYGFVCFLFANLTLVEYSIFHIGLLLIIIFNQYYLSRIKK